MEELEGKEDGNTNAALRSLAPRLLLYRVMLGYPFYNLHLSGDVKISWLGGGVTDVKTFSSGIVRFESGSKVWWLSTDTSACTLDSSDGSVRGINWNGASSGGGGDTCVVRMHTQVLIDEDGREDDEYEEKLRKEGFMSSYPKAGRAYAGVEGGEGYVHFEVRNSRATTYSNKGVSNPPPPHAHAVRLRCLRKCSAFPG